MFELFWTQSPPDGREPRGPFRKPRDWMVEQKGFEPIIDSGLGATVDGYRKFRMNVFDSSRNPADHFQGVEDQNREVAQELLKLPAYQVIARSHSHSGYGAAMLADIAVAVPFVSAVVGALAITQAIRIATGEAHHIALTADTGELKSLRAVLGMRAERVTVGNVRAASSDVAGDFKCSPEIGPNVRINANQAPPRLTVAFQIGRAVPS